MCADGFLHCEWCGNSYSDSEPWCPHCLAPRPMEKQVEKDEPSSDGYCAVWCEGHYYSCANFNAIESNMEGTTYYSDNTVYTVTHSAFADAAHSLGIPPMEPRPEWDAYVSQVNRDLLSDVVPIPRWVGECAFGPETKKAVESSLGRMSFGSMTANNEIRRMLNG